MRRPLLIVAAIAVVTAIQIVWLAPATLVGRRLEQATAGALRLVDCEGTIWHARAMLVGGGARLPIAWNLEFWPLLHGEARIRIGPYAGTTTGPPRARLQLRTGSISVHDVDIVIPAPMLAALAAAPAGWSVTGEVAFSAAALEWSPPKSRGDLVLVWRRARLAPVTDGVPIDLGNVSVTLKAEGDAMGGPIRNDGGALSVAGEARARNGDDTIVKLELAPRAGDDSALEAALTALGPKSNAGWRVEWRIPPR
jgi:hypothetical protein